MSGKRVPTRDASSRPRVWFVNHYAHLPHESGGLTRHFDFARELKALGWDVTIIAAGTTHPAGTCRLSPWGRSRTEIFDEVTLIWIPVTPYRGNGADRMLNMGLFFLRTVISRRLRNLARPDVIVGSTPHPLSAFAGWMLARRCRVPFVYEVRDLWPQALIEMGRLKPGSLVARGMHRLEKFLAESATRIVALWQHFDWYFAERDINARNVTWISNGFSEDRFAEVSAKGKKSNPFTYVYFGSHGNANDLKTALDAMVELREMGRARTIRLKLIGEGPLKPALKKMALERKLDSVEFMDPVPKDRVGELADDADAFLLTLRSLPLFRYGFSPNKLYEYMALNRPVVFCCETLPNPVVEADAGLVVPPGDAQALARAMADLADANTAELQAKGQRGREFVKRHFTISALAIRYERVLREANNTVGTSDIAK